MKILLLGKNGQVGHALQRTLLLQGEVVALGRDELDLLDSNAIVSTLKDIKPNIIINAAAFTAVDKAETEIEQAFAINERVPKMLADYALKHNTLLIHYSTDYVFDGQKEGAYEEADTTNPLNIYGQSKRAGEIAIQNTRCRHLIFRTSWVYSQHGHNFIKTILRLANEKESLNIVDDQWGAPTSAELIADTTALALQANKISPLQSGIYHLTAKGVTSWYALAKYVLDIAESKGLNLKLKSQQVYPIKTAAYPLPAVRPQNSALNLSKLESALQVSLPQWQVYVERMLNQVLV